MAEIKNSKKLSQPECVASLNAVGDAFYVIGGKWKLRIIIALSDGAKRFNELQRLVEGISARVLSSELKDLEMNGLVTRNVHADSFPVVVEYEATGYADSLRDVLKALTAWGTMHRKRIRKQAEFERQRASNVSRK
ncbi:winged helix-turn-helix transcriptional regulator [Chryseolinea soli]|uniref:Transcriptional regulator n=1 Tax=Chryseolinea soli TaxID=2321403 RepID=A0A385SMS5_9BACT|nr:helix-turn-helix domain-containing protein [Chryseolinea soli]AYB31577.1 transcriptional regulator [Chryseolinea soli]